MASLPSQLALRVPHLHRLSLATIGRCYSHSAFRGFWDLGFPPHSPEISWHSWLLIGVRDPRAGLPLLELALHRTSQVPSPCLRVTRRTPAWGACVVVRPPSLAG